MKIGFEDMSPTLEGEGVELRTRRIGDDIVLARFRCAAGTDFSGAVKGLPHDACPCEHWGYVISGRMVISSYDGESAEYGPGDAFHLHPGHMPDFKEDTEFIEYTPREQFETLLGNMGVTLP